MGKSTIFRSERVRVGLHSFEPGQEHALHAHEGMMDKVCQWPLARTMLRARSSWL